MWAPNYYLPIKVENVCQIEFGVDKNVFFYTETDSANRPCSVKMMDLNSNRTVTIFTDDDPTHYIDLGVTKDKKYLTIASNTKEDSEVWVLPRDVEINENIVTPT